MDARLLDWLSVRLAPDMTRPRFYSLMSKYATPAEVFGASGAEIARVRGFDANLARGVLSNRGAAEVHRHAEKLESMGVRIVTRDDADYPVNLAQSSLGPPLLFVKGTLAPEDRYSIAMVGSRHATQYGRAVSSQFAAGLARYGMTVVSGFARGIDGEAHNAALKAGGRTIAVLGNGLDVCYPSEHRGLVEKVAANGALVTEYPLGTSPDRFNFPERNHVIAALSLGTLVVEAAEKSGSLITARLAVEENRFIFAVPGDITRNNSRGANSLIMQGARMVQRPQDVLLEMKDVLRGYLNEDLLEAETAEAEPEDKPRQRGGRQAKEAAAGAGVRAEGAATTAEGAEAKDVTEDDLFSETVATLAIPAVKPVAAAKRVVSLTEEEKFVIDLLRHEAMVFDELAVHAYGRGIDVPRLTSLLMKLELRTVIRQLPGRYYVLFE